MITSVLYVPTTVIVLYVYCHTHCSPILCSTFNTVSNIDVALNGIAKQFKKKIKVAGALVHYKISSIVYLHIVWFRK